MSKIKCLAVILSLMLVAIPAFTADLAGDLDGNGSVTLEDIAYTMAWFLKGRTSDKQLVVTTATGLYANATGPVVRLPDTASDSFFGGNIVDLNDIAIMMAYFLKGRSTDFETVRSQAISLYQSANVIYKLPGTPVGDSTVPVTVTGIQVDP